MKQDSKDPVSRVTKEIKVQVGVKELLGILEKKETMEIRGTLGVLVRCVLHKDFSQTIVLDIYYACFQCFRQ